MVKIAAQCINLFVCINVAKFATPVCKNYKTVWKSIHGDNFMALFITLRVVIWSSTGTLGIFATLVEVFTVRVVIYDILSMAIIPTLSTSILFCNLCYILLSSPRSVVKVAIRI